MKRIIFTIILILAIVFLYGHYIEINNIKTHEYVIKNESIPDAFNELKIVHFSDILYNKNSEKLVNIRKKINQENADVIIFSGDLFKSGINYQEEDYNMLKKFLSSMDAELFKFAVIGDNDLAYLDQYKSILEASNFILLDNDYKLLFYKDITPINIIGLTDTTSNLEHLFTHEVDYNYTLAIMHKPDEIINLNKYKIDAVLSGHSLGGVINLPFYGGIMTKDGAKKYVNEYYLVNNTNLYISNGLGNDINYRLFNTPSYNVYRFSN